MPISFATRVETPADVMVQDLQGESVLLNVASGHYYGLDAVGTRMWKAVTIARSLETAYDSLRTVYDVNAEQLRRDLHNLVEKLAGHGLLEVRRD